MDEMLARTYAAEGLKIACFVQVKTDHEQGVNPAKLTARGYSQMTKASVSRVIAAVDAWDYTAARLGLPTSRELTPLDLAPARFDSLLTVEVADFYDKVYRLILKEWKLPREQRTIQTVDRSLPRGPLRHPRTRVQPPSLPLPPVVTTDNEPWPDSAYPTMLDYALGKTRSDRAQICTLRLAIRSALRVLDDPNSHDRSVEDRMHSARSILLGELDDIKGREQEERASATDPGDREYQRALRKIRQGRRHKNSAPL